ncbi:MAG: hypothetical protein ABSH47_15575 [Bryobacteraceae bacterium]
MKRVISVTIFGACLLAISPAIRAQNCSYLTTVDLRGTYTMSGSGWIDLSKFLAGIPGLPPLPTGLIPMSWVGAHTWDGAGGGGGWVSINAAGNQMSASFVGLKYSINPDCSIPVSFSMKINELPGVTVGPVSRLMVPVAKYDGLSWMPWALELHMMTVGTAPGTSPGPGIDSGVAYRISMQY